jgi:hypothetical protein
LPGDRTPIGDFSKYFQGFPGKSGLVSWLLPL